MVKARISSIQLFLLFIGFLYGSTVIVNSALGAKNDAWLAILLGGTVGGLLVGVYVSVAYLNPSKTLVEILKERLGNVMGNIISIMYVWYFIHLAALVFRNFGEFIIVVTYQETPISIVIAIFAAIMVYAVNSGVEVIGRLSELFVPVLPFTVLIICMAVITTHDFTAFSPILENGIKPVLKAAFSFITFPFGESVAFLMLFPHLNKKENLKKIAVLSIISMIALSLLLFFRDIIVLGSEVIYQATFVPHLTELLFPGISVEQLVDINLLIGGGVKVSICIYAAVRALSQVAGIDDYRNLTTAITTFCVVLSLWIYENVLEMLNWAEKVWPYYSIFFQIIVPLLLLFLSFIKKNKSSKSTSSNAISSS